MVKGCLLFFSFKSTSRDKSRKNPQWSKVVTSLNPVIPHLNIVVSIFSEHKKKSILFEPFRNDLESHSLPCLLFNGSNNFHSRHILAIPSESLVKGSFPSQKPVNNIKVNSIQQQQNFEEWIIYWYW